MDFCMWSHVKHILGTGLVPTLRLKIRSTPTQFSPTGKATHSRWAQMLSVALCAGGPVVVILPHCFPASVPIFPLLSVIPSDDGRHLKEGLDQTVMLCYLNCVPSHWQKTFVGTSLEKVWIECGHWTILTGLQAETGVIMLYLYHVLILSKTDCHIFWCGPSVKPKLSVTEFVHRTGIHFATQAFCTSHLEGVRRIL